MSQKIRDVMTTETIQLAGNRTVAEAAKKMRDANIGNVLVMRGAELSGIVTDRDVVVRCVAEGKDPEKTELESICSDALATMGPDDDTDTAVNLMRKKAIRRIPIVEGGSVLGVLSLGDLAVQKDPKSALGQISSAAPNT